MATSELACTVLVSLEGIWLKFIHTAWKHSANTEFCLHISTWYHSNYPAKKSSWPRRKQGVTFASLSSSGNFQPENAKCSKQAQSEQRSNIWNPKDSVHNPACMSWHQVRRWTHNKYSNSKNILNSHCSPNACYLFLNTDSVWIMAHITRQYWGISIAKQDVWWRHTPESNTSKIQQAFTVAVLPFGCIQGSSLAAF